MARAITVYANSTTARLQDSYGLALSVAAVRLLFAETVTITLAVVDDDRAAVDLTGITAGWNLALKRPDDLDGTSLLAAKAGTVTDAEGGLVAFEFSGTDLSSSSLGSYLADPLAPPQYGKPVVLEIYRMPASDKIVYAAGAITVARGAYDPSADGAPVNQPTIALAFGTGSDGALTYTAADGWTLAGVAMTTTADWTVAGASLTLRRSLDCTDCDIGPGAQMVVGAELGWQVIEIRCTGTFRNRSGATISAGLLGTSTVPTTAGMSSPGTPITTTGTGPAPNRLNESWISLSRPGASGQGGGTGTGGNPGGAGHTPSFSVPWQAVRVAAGSTTAGTTGPGANGLSQSVAALYIGSDPDCLPRMAGAPGAAGGGGAVTLQGGGTSGTGGIGGTAGLGGGILIFRCWGFSNAGTIRANGQAGGNGGDGTASGGATAGGGGGGSGGGGGQVVVYYGGGGYANTGTIEAVGGLGGTGGAGSGAGAGSTVGNPGGNGGAGSAGQIWTKRVA